MNIRKTIIAREVLVALPGVALLTGLALFNPSGVSANHPVLVEGNNCADAGPGETTVPPGTCGDYDGDGRIGAAEDTDNATDRVFGTLNVALGNRSTGDDAIDATRANQNGRVTIVTSGRFAEIVTITGANGNVTLEAAPGVEANIDAVVQGAPDNGNVARQNSPGILVNAPSTRVITLRNLISRNWTQGIQVSGDSRVVIDNCRVENNRDFGIRAMGSARVTIVNSLVTASGFRVSGGVVNVPSPGVGIEFAGGSSGTVGASTISSNFAGGISNATGDPFAVCLHDLTVFDNRPNLSGVVGHSCPLAFL